jgi:hypothetical protein
VQPTEQWVQTVLQFFTAPVASLVLWLAAQNRPVAADGGQSANGTDRTRAGMCAAVNIGLFPKHFG